MQQYTFLNAYIVRKRLFNINMYIISNLHVHGVLYLLQRLHTVYTQARSTAHSAAHLHVQVCIAALFIILCLCIDFFSFTFPNKP